MARIRSIQPAQPENAGLPVLWYYLVTVAAVTCLVIVFLLVALTKYREVILNSKERQARTNLGDTANMLEDAARDSGLAVTGLTGYFEEELRRRALDPETQGTPADSAYWQDRLARAAAALPADETVPQRLFLIATPDSAELAENALTTPPPDLNYVLAQARAGEAQGWEVRARPPAEFAASGHLALAEEAQTDGTMHRRISYSLETDPPSAEIVTVRPVRAGGRIVGVFGLVSRLDPLLASIEQRRVGDSGGMVLVDTASATLLTRPLGGLRHISGIFQAPDRFTYSLLRDPAQPVGQAVMGSTLSSVRIIGDDGRPYHTLVERVEDSPWSVLAYFPDAEVEAEFSRQSRTLLIMGVALLLTVVGAIFLLNRVLASSLKRLVTVVSQPLAKVDENSISQLRAPEDGPREIATLAAAYNRLLQTVKEEVHANAEYAKRLESNQQHLSGFNRLLEKVVADRTRELERSKEVAERARENAERAQKFAEEANEAKSNFLANISHELRTPMNAILGYTELLMEDAEDAGTTDSLPDLHKVLTAGKHLLTLIDDILDIARIEAGRMNLKFETFHVGEMLQEVVEATQPLTRDHLNSLHFGESCGEVQMIADRTKVKQILFNLASNACKFTERGEIHISAVCAVVDGIPCLVCEVKDTGIGMSEEQLNRIFEKFSQVDESSTRKHGGTGLGLFICRNFTEMMNGSINVASKPGGGSTFTLELPLDVPAAMAEREKATIQAVERSIKANRPATTRLD